MRFVRLACVKHAASVHPEPGSNSLYKFVSGQDNLWLPIPFTVCWFLTVRYSMKFALSPSSHKPDVPSALFKNFRESYVSHCSVIKVPVSQTAHLLYHIFHFLSTTFLSFLNCLNCIFKMYSCDSSVRIPQSPDAVNCFFKTFFAALFCILLFSALVYKRLSEFHYLP